jgi:hypothetical protein
MFLSGCETMPAFRSLAELSAELPADQAKAPITLVDLNPTAAADFDSAADSEADAGTGAPAQPPGHFFSRLFGGGVCDSSGQDASSHGSGGQNAGDPPGEDCAEQAATKADDCLREAINLPLNIAYRDPDMRRLLDCAERHYRAALAHSKAEPGSSRRVAFHGGLLLTLSERRNRLDNLAGEARVERENDKLLAAADAARDEAPDDALGFLYGASARLFRATLIADTTQRCADLRDATKMLTRAPAPPDALFEEQARLSALAIAELDQCNPLPKIAAQGRKPRREPGTLSDHE